MSPSTRERIMDAVVACVDERGLRGFALEDVAEVAGTSRATIYRHFEGGRPQLISETVRREVGRFWLELAEEVAEVDGLEDRLVAGIMAAHRRLATHDLMQRLLAIEPEELLVPLFEAEPAFHSVVRDYLEAFLVHEGLDRTAAGRGIDLTEAADYLARMLTVHIGSPGRWDLEDPESVRRLVRTQFLAGLM